MRPWKPLLFPLILCAGAVCADDSAATLRDRLETPDAVIRAGGLALLDTEGVRAFYLRRDASPAWLGADCEARVAELAAAVATADRHGFEPADYHHERLARGGPCEVDTELLATDAWLSLGDHLHRGRVDPVSVEPDWTARRQDIDLAARLAAALEEGTVRRSLMALAPAQPYYQTLQLALAEQRRQALHEIPICVADGAKLRLGDSGPRVFQLRSRLIRAGLLDAEEAPDSDRFDPALEAAVKAFQQRANLEPDGIVGPMTLGQLNLCAADRVAQLRANLERWRWLPDDLGQRHIRVNIADFRLEARAGGIVEREHKVIVGRTYRRTPVFSDEIEYLVFNPWWETPRRLAVQDKLPQFREDPAAIDRLGFEIVDAEGANVDPAVIDWQTVSGASFPYRLRQRPGPENALGQVKLMFPNPHNVYLHDTPTRALFEKTRRDFSSGCIRVEDALGLAEWVLAETSGWDRARIDSAVASGAPTTVNVTARVPIHVLYLTAVPDAGGGVRFVDDLYARDAAIVAALDAPPPGHETRR